MNKLSTVAGKELDKNIASQDINTEPSEKQIESGTYKKGKIRLYGLGISIENPKGSSRKGIDDDGNAWETISKVNTVWGAGTFVPGDSILFKRGSTFHGTITVTESGTEGNEIIVSAYNSGDNPIITGFITIPSWTDYGEGDIYYY